MPKIERVIQYLKKFKKLLYSDQGLAFLIGIAVALIASTAIERKQPETRPLKQEATLSATTHGPSLGQSLPVKLRLPKFGQVISFGEPLGLNKDKTVEVPKDYDMVGWYKYSKTPGEIGPAIVLGHVDSYQGPAVFFRLKEFKKGDDIFIDRADGSVAHFRVDEIKFYEQSEFPTDIVYGKSNNATLRLITCTGVYNQGEQQYSHNLVVYASLVL